jgi:ParB family chromosome partitioning protein
MTVAVAETYVDRLLTNTVPAGEKHRTLFVLKDVRVFLNSLNHGLEIMKRGGIEADLEKRETEDRLILTVSIPKHSQKKNRG